MATIYDPSHEGLKGRVVSDVTLDLLVCEKAEQYEHQMTMLKFRRRSHSIISNFYGVKKYVFTPMLVEYTMQPLTI